jgi:hypothetical protein
MIQKAIIAALFFSLTWLNAADSEVITTQPQTQPQNQNITIHNVANNCKEQDRAANNCGGPMTLNERNTVVLSVVGEGVAPSSTISPAQARALAKRAAIADAYRQMAEKVNGVKIEGRDYVRNMVAKRSEVRTCVSALIKNAAVVESRFNEGLFEVEMELRVAGNQWYEKFLQ